MTNEARCSTYCIPVTIIMSTVFVYLAGSSIEAWVRLTFIHIYLTVLSSVPSNAVAPIVIDKVLREGQEAGSET